MTKINLKYAEFYVTNVCNLACDNCNRFNNMDFKGKYDFDVEQYREWAEKLDIHRLAILGGEPTYHPNLASWIEGISTLWPKTLKMLITNGTRLNYKGLHELLTEYNWTLEINLHKEKNSDFSKKIIHDLKKHFGPIEFVEEGCWGKEGLTYRSSKGVTIFLRNKWIFHRSAIKDYNTLEDWNSNGKLAHSLCTMKTCHHFFDGKLYKCGVAKLLPDFLKQKGKIVKPYQKDYKPLEVSNLSQQSLDALSNKPIDMCASCPDGTKAWQSAPFETLYKKDIKI